MSNPSKELERITVLLNEQSTLALATADETGQPSVAPLFYIVGENLSLLWLSAETSLHTVNLKRNSSVAVTVYAHTDKWREIRGVQMRGTVTVITDPAGRSAIVKTYCRRFRLRAIFRLAISRCALYAFRPDFIRYIDNARGLGARVELERGRDNEWKIAGS